MTFVCVDIKTLAQSQQHRFRPSPDVVRLPPIHGNVHERAGEALEYLSAVSDHHFELGFHFYLSFSRQALRSNEIHRRTQPIENHESSNEDVETSEEIESAMIVSSTYPIARHPSKVLIDSHNHLTGDRRLKGIILHKATIAYFYLADHAEKEGQYGSCLKYLRLAINCYRK